MSSWNVAQPWNEKSLVSPCWSQWAESSGQGLHGGRSPTNAACSFNHHFSFLKFTFLPVLLLKQLYLQSCKQGHLSTYTDQSDVHNIRPILKIELVPANEACWKMLCLCFFKTCLVGVFASSPAATITQMKNPIQVAWQTFPTVKTLSSMLCLFCVVVPVCVAAMIC